MIGAPGPTATRTALPARRSSAAPAGGAATSVAAKCVTPDSDDARGVNAPGQQHARDRFTDLVVRRARSGREANSHRTGALQPLTRGGFRLQSDRLVAHRVLLRVDTHRVF